MQREGEQDEATVAHLVADDASDDNAEAEAGETRATDRAKLRAGEAEFRTPIIEDSTADGKANARG
jgi:hypothetical protein